MFRQNVEHTSLPEKQATIEYNSFRSGIVQYAIIQESFPAIECHVHGFCGKQTENSENATNETHLMKKQR